MNDALYRTAIVYDRLSRKNGHHTDSSRGSQNHFLARMLTGTSRFVGEGYDITFSPGEMYYIPLGFRYHSYWYGDSVTWDTIAFRWFPGGTNQIPQKLEPTAEQLCEFNALTAGWRIDCAHVGRFYSLLGSLLNGMKTPDGSEPSAVFKTATELLAGYPYLSVGEIARRCNVSESGLFAEFRKFGTTPVKYRLRTQTDKARNLLITTDLTVEEISEQCGFSSTAYFYRVFRRLTGKTTREVRYERMM